MRETLVIHLEPQADSQDGGPVQCTWRRLHSESAQAPMQGACALVDVLKDWQGERIVLLVPSEHLSLKQVDLPVRQASKLLQAVPYALEDQLAADVDHLHFALGPRQDGNINPVAVVDHVQMQRWLQPFEEARIQPDLMLPDVLALPWQADQTSVYVDALGRCLVRNGACSGFATHASLLSTLLPAADDQALFLLQSADVKLPEAYSIARSQSAANLLEALGSLSDSSQRINLLQGRYAPKRATDQWLRAARWPAALAASWIVLSSATLALSNQQKQARFDQLQTRALEEFSAAFPETTRIVDVRVQAGQQLSRLKSGGGEDGFMKLLSESTPALNKVPKLSVDALQFRDGSLYISLTGSELQALEVLRAEFAKIQALKLDVQSAQAGTDGVQIRLKVDQA